MVERHLRAYGPVTADDLCFYLGGLRKTPVRRALAALGRRVITGQGPAGQPMLDLDDELAGRVDPPESGTGVHLLAEFDGAADGYRRSGPPEVPATADKVLLVWSTKNAVCVLMA